MALTGLKVKHCQGSNPVIGLAASNKDQNSNIPWKYAYFENEDDYLGSPGVDIPIIDYSLFISGDHHQRSIMIQQLGQACQEWSFFIVINHGLPEKLTSSLMEASDEFFTTPESESNEYTMNKDVVNGIRIGNTDHLSTTDHNFYFWRNYMKMFVRPNFHSPNQPQRFRDTLKEFNNRQREIAEELLKGVSKSLDLEENYLCKITNRETGADYLTINVYPPCPWPELAVGLSAHTDFGLLVLIMQNGVDGLQIQHKGKWFNVNAPSNSIMVGLGDQMEILTNGKYKSVIHRATLNKETTRMSIATFYGPSFNTVVTPAPAFVDDNNPPVYRGMKYVDYYKIDQTNKSKGTTTLDIVRIESSDPTI